MKRLITAFRKLFDRLLLNRSDDLKRSLRNATYSSLDYLLLPILWIIGTPILVSRLGTDQYGIWALANTFMGLSGVFAFGLGAATIKYVSKYRALNDEVSIVRVIRSTLTMYAVFGLVAGLIIFAAAPLLVTTIFSKIQGENVALAVAALRVGAFGIMVRFIDEVFHAGMHGFERYDLSAKISMVITVLIVSMNVGLVLAGFSVSEMLLASIIIIFTGALVKAFILKRQLVPNLVIAPLIDIPTLKEVFSFGIYSWVQSLSYILLSQADKFIIASLLGPSALTYYAVCLQLAQQIHTLISKAASFLFPLASVVQEQGDTKRLRSFYFKGIHLTTILGVAIGFPMFMLSHSILTLWMGQAFADEAAIILRILSFTFTLLVTSIVPYYYLNGTGFVRLNALFGLASGLIVSVTALLTIPILGVAGAAWARAANAPIDVISRTVLHFRVLDDRRWYAGIYIFLPVLVAFAIGLLLLQWFGEPSLNFLGLIGLGSLYALLGLGMGYGVTRSLTRVQSVVV